MSRYTNIDDIDLKGNYTFDDGITVNADSLQRAEEKRKRRLRRMKTEEMIRELRRLEDKHKNDFTGTCENNWSAMCHDVADRLEEQEREIAELNYTIEALKIGGCL